MDPSWIPGEPALSMPGGSGIWGDAAWQVGAGSGGTVATVAGCSGMREFDEIPNVHAALGDEIRMCVWTPQLPLF